MENISPNYRDYSIKSELDFFSELLSGEYYNYKLRNLAEKIKQEQYRPKPKMLFY